MSFETVALFPGSSLIKFKTSFLETVSKQKFSLPKFSFIFLQLSSFSKFIFAVDLGRFNLLVIFVKYSLKVLEIFLLSLRVSFFSVKIMLLLVLHLSVKKGLTVFQKFPLSVISLMFRFPQNIFLVDFSIFEQILRFAYNFASFQKIVVFRSLDHFMIA